MTFVRPAFGVLLLVASMPAFSNEDAVSPSDSTRGAATPAEAFEGFRDSVVKQDWQSAFRYMTPESRDAIVSALLRGAYIGIVGEEGKALAARSVTDVSQLKKLLDEMSEFQRTVPRRRSEWKEEVSQQATRLQGELAALVKDPPKFTREALTLWREKKSENVLNMLENAKLDRVQIDGDSAKANFHVRAPEGSGSEDVTFKKVDGRWFVDKRG